MKRLYLVILASLFIMTSCAQGSKNNYDENKDAGLTSEVESSFEKYPIKIFKSDGKLYYDTGEYSQMTPRCGTLDGMFEEFCDEYEIPQEDAEANFKSDDDYYENGWQGVSVNTREVPTIDGWKIFKRVETDLKTDLSDYKYCMRLCGKLPDGEEKSEYIVFTNDKNVTLNDVLETLSNGGKEQYIIPVKYGEAYNWGITLSAKDVTSTEMTLVFTQKGGAPKGMLQIGSEYSIDRWNGKFWEIVQPKAEVAWIAIAYLIPKDTETEFPINWEYLYGELPAGKYRISKEVSDFVVANNYDKHTYYAEFEIGE